MRVSASRDGERLAQRMERTDHGAIVFGEASAGDTRGIVLETSPEGPMRIVPPEELVREFEETRDFWRSWIGRSRYQGRWRETVERSAMTLKLMTYAPTGALVAAPTAGLPEQVGGERNWDYRFTWIRDASFSVYALLGLGFTSEAAAFLQWLNDRVRHAAERSAPLQIMYRIDGSPDLEEFTLDHFEGYRGSSPVRIGNGAATQLQLDIYGEALDSIHLADAHELQMSHTAWMNLVNLMDWLCDHWDQPDDGIWETRGGRQDFVYGRLMSWVAFDRAVRMAQSRGRPGDTGRWTNMRDMIYRQIMERGYHPKREAFVQHYNTDVLDVSALHATGRFRRTDLSDVAVDAARHGRGAGLRQPRLPLRPGGIARRPAGFGRDLHHLLILVRRCARPVGPARGRPVDLREDADVRQPARALLRGDRAHG